MDSFKDDAKAPLGSWYVEDSRFSPNTDDIFGNSVIDVGSINIDVEVMMLLYDSLLCIFSWKVIIRRFSFV